MKIIYQKIVKHEKKCMFIQLEKVCKKVEAVLKSNLIDKKNI